MGAWPLALGQKGLGGPEIVLPCDAQEANRKKGTGAGIYLVAQNTEHCSSTDRYTFKHIPQVTTSSSLPELHLLKFTPPAEDEACTIEAYRNISHSKTGHSERQLQTS